MIRITEMIRIGNNNFNFRNNIILRRGLFTPFN